MARRINTATDIKILEDLALGHTNKKIAETYDVSTSYVSKIKMGRKSIDFSTVVQTTSDKEINSFISTRITTLEQELAILKNIQQKIKGD